MNVIALPRKLFIIVNNNVEQLKFAGVHLARVLGIFYNL